MQRSTSWAKPEAFPQPVRIVYVWTLVLLGMVLYAMAWFTLGSVAMTFIDAVLLSFNFAAPWDSVVEIAKNVILWHPIISLFGWILWGFLNSMRRDVRTWKIG